MDRGFMINAVKFAEGVSKDMIASISAIMPAAESYAALTIISRLMQDFATKQRNGLIEEEIDMDAFDKVLGEIVEIVSDRTDKGSKCDQTS